MDDVKKIAYCLDAAGGVMSEQGFHLLYVRDNELIEELWDTNGVLDIVSVGDEIKTDAPAAYIWVGATEDDEQDKRIVFSVTHDDTLRYFTYNNYIDEWEESDFSYAAHIQLAPDSGLTGDLGPDGPAIFFVDVDGNLQTLIMEGNGWKLGDALDVSPRVGSPLSITPVDEGILVFYIGDDDMLHYLAQNTQSGDWQDHYVEHVIMEAPVSRFKISRDPDTGFFEAYFLSEEKLIRFAGEGGEMEEVGKMNGRELIKNNAAQSVYKTFLSGLVTRDGRAYGFKVSERTTRTFESGGSWTTYRSRTYPF
ncbi:hypothetical protein N7486_000712 [Penicillium sp. IBT 16267x]|nr:hypothetical protein N7486_000712 [Penicillium sp. IBT 16267x]